MNMNKIFALIVSVLLVGGIQFLTTQPAYAKDDNCEKVKTTKKVKKTGIGGMEIEVTEVVEVCRTGPRPAPAPLGPPKPGECRAASMAPNGDGVRETLLPDGIVETNRFLIDRYVNESKELPDCIANTAAGCVWLPGEFRKDNIPDWGPKNGRKFLGLQVYQGGGKVGSNP